MIKVMSLCTLIGTYGLVSVGAEMNLASSSPQSHQEESHSTNAIAAQQSSFEADLDKALEACKGAYDFAKDGVVTNFSDYISLGLSFHIGNFEERHLKQLDSLPEDEKKRIAPRLFDLYYSKTACGLESLMSTIRDLPTMEHTMSLRYLTEDLGRTRQWEAYLDDKDAGRRVDRLTRRVDRIPYENAMAFVEHHVANKTYPIGALRRLNDAVRHLISSRYALSVDEYNAFLERSNKAVRFINESYKGTDDNLKRYLKEEGAVFKELRGKLGESFKQRK